MYKRQRHPCPPAGSDRSSRRQEETGIFRNELIGEPCREMGRPEMAQIVIEVAELRLQRQSENPCLLYTSDAADDLLCVALGGRRILKT